MRERRSHHQNPFIKNILGGSSVTRGNNIKEAGTGECIRIVGRRFGRSSAKVVVYFDEISVKPMSFPFSDSEMIVICPLVKKETKSLRIRVGRDVSNVRRFKVTQPETSSEPVGTVTKRYFDTIDHAAALVAGLGRAIAPYTPYQKELSNTAQDIDHTRVVLQTVNNLLMKWEPMQNTMDFEPFKTIKTMDDFILQSHLVEGAENYIDVLFGDNGPVAKFLGKEFLSVDTFFGTAKDLGSYFGSIIEETGLLSPALGPFYDASGFILHEFTKFVEGGENLAKLLKPSVEGGVGAGLEGSIDAEFDWGQIFSVIAKLIDIEAQILTKISTIISGKESSEKIDKLEEKADRERVLVFDLKIKLDHLEEDVKKIEEKLDRIEQKNDTQDEKLDKLETKSDKTEEKLDRIGEKIDRLEQKSDRAEEKLDTLEIKSDKAEEKLDRLEQKNDREEQKLDRAEQKLDILEQKADKAEEKLDRLEEKNDKEEQKLDKLEQKADKAEQKLDKLEQKNDKEEQKLDKIEGKMDKAEQKLDLMEQKADKAEQKLDKLEQKNDKEEQKLDKIEQKADKAELKLDKLEAKNDKEEEKLDKIEVKLDTWPIYHLPHESSIADQQTGTGKSTAAMIALKADNNVYLKAAINVTSHELDDETKWTSWKNFNRPANAQVLVGVSIDLQYLENSTNIMDGVITVRDGNGKIYIRTFKGKAHQEIATETEWSDWKDFPGQP